MIWILLPVLLWISWLNYFHVIRRRSNRMELDIHEMLIMPLFSPIQIQIIFCPSVTEDLSLLSSSYSSFSSRSNSNGDENHRSQSGKHLASRFFCHSFHHLVEITLVYPGRIPSSRTSLSSSVRTGNFRSGWENFSFSWTSKMLLIRWGSMYHR